MLDKKEIVSEIKDELWYLIDRLESHRIFRRNTFLVIESLALFLLIGDINMITKCSGNTFNILCIVAIIFIIGMFACKEFCIGGYKELIQVEFLPEIYEVLERQNISLSGKPRSRKQIEKSIGETKYLFGDYKLFDSNITYSGWVEDRHFNIFETSWKRKGRCQYNVYNALVIKLSLPNPVSHSITAFTPHSLFQYKYSFVFNWFSWIVISGFLFVIYLLTSLNSELLFVVVIALIMLMLETEKYFETKKILGLQKVSQNKFKIFTTNPSNQQLVINPMFTDLILKLAKKYHTKNVRFNIYKNNCTIAIINKSGFLGKIDNIFFSLKKESVYKDLLDKVSIIYELINAVNSD